MVLLEMNLLGECGGGLVHVPVFGYNGVVEPETVAILASEADSEVSGFGRGEGAGPTYGIGLTRCRRDAGFSPGKIDRAVGSGQGRGTIQSHVEEVFGLQSVVLAGCIGAQSCVGDGD